MLVESSLEGLLLLLNTEEVSGSLRIPVLVGVTQSSCPEAGVAFYHKNNFE